MPRSQYLLFALMIIFGSCTSKGESQLSKALSGALKEHKISADQKTSILKEYDFVREEDRGKAREYVIQVVNAIKMGGDSSHIDVARRQVVESLKHKVKV